MCRRPILRPRLIALVLACAAASAPATAKLGSEEDSTGALIGDLMFHADLMAALDALCPARASRDWRAVVASLPADARTPRMSRLSQRLASDAARSMVHGSGGCATPAYAEAHARTRAEYEALLEQWARLGA